MNPHLKCLGAVLSIFIGIRRPMAIKSSADVFKKLPLAIRKARARAMEHPSLFGLGRVMALVQTLISYTNLDALQTPLRFNRNSPAKVLNVSTRTIDRLLTQLEGLGWLSRLPQPRLKQGVWGVTSIQWADWVLASIFVIPKGKDKWGNDTAPAPHRATKVAHLSNSSKEEVDISNKPLKETRIQKEGAFDPFDETRDQRRRIPKELVPAMELLEIKPSTLCWLMARCKRNGSMLQDILIVATPAFNSRITCKKERLRYITYLTGLKKDFKPKAQEVSAKLVVKARSKNRLNWLQTLATLAFKPNRLLPSGSRVVRQDKELVIIENEQGQQTASPWKTLITNLICHFPHWARKLNRPADTLEFAAFCNSSSPSPSPVKASKASKSSLEAIQIMKGLLGKNLFSRAAGGI